MSKLVITDLSVTEELGRQAMAAVRGGHGRHGHPPYGMAWGRHCYGEPKPQYPQYGDVSQVAQAGQSIININGSLSGVDFSNTVSAGSVTATATNNA